MDRTLSLLVKFGALDKLTAPLRAMSGASKRTGRDLAATRKEVLGLERAAGKVGGFRDLQAKIAASHAEMDQARRRVTALKAAIAAADGPTGRLARSLEAAQGKVARLERSTGAQVTRLDALRRELGEAGVDVANLAREEDRLGRALDMTNRRLREQSDAADRAASRQARVDRADALGGRMRAGGAAAMATGGAIVAPLALAAKSADETRSAYTDIALTAGMSADEVGRLARTVDRMAPRVAQLPVDLREGVGLLVAAGVPVKQALALMPSIGRTATAQRAAVDDLANVSFANFSNLKVPIADNQRALDAMTVAGKSGQVELRAMAGLFPSLTAAAGALGQKGVGAAADLASALQIARRGAGSDDEAGNNIANVLNKINTKDTIANFKKFGVDLPKAMKRAYAEGKTPLEAIAELTRKALGGDMSRLSFLFGDAQVQAGLRPLIEGMEDYRRIRDEAMKGSGVNDRDFARRMEMDPSARGRRMSGQRNVLVNTVGEAVSPALERANQLAGDWSERVAGWAQANPAAARTMGGLGLVVGVFVTLLGALGIAAGFVWPVLARGWTLFARLGPLLGRAAPMLRLFGGMFGWIARGALAAAGVIAGFVGLPVWLVAAIGVAIAAAGVLIYRNWDRIKAAFGNGLAYLRGLWGSFREAGANIVRGLASGIVAMFGAVKARIQQLGHNAIGWFKGVLGIKSPSRVFAQLGGHMMGGLALGLDRGVDRPLARIRAAGTGMARAMAVAPLAVSAPTLAAAAPLSAAPRTAAATGAAQPAAFGPVTIHITQRPGEDADALADRVIRRMERLKRTARESSFRDDD